MYEEREDLKGSTIRKFPLPYFIASVIFIAIFIGAFLVSFINNKNLSDSFSLLWICIYAVLGIAIFFVACQLITMLPEPSPKIERLAFAIILIIIFVLQLCVANDLKNNINMSSYGAQPFEYAVGHVFGKTAPGDYFIFHPEQIGAYTIWNLFIFIFEAFGIAEFSFWGTLVNILFIDVALIIFYRCVRAILGGLRALLAMVAALITLPFLAFVPLFSAEVLALPFVMALVLFWTKARKAWRGEEYESFYLNFFFVCIFSVFGAFLHGAVLAFWVVICLDFLFLLRGAKRKAIVLLLGSIVTLGVFIGGTLYLANSPLLSQHDYADNAVPIKYYMISAWGQDERETGVHLQDIMSFETQAKKNERVDEIFAEVFGAWSPSDKVRFFADRLGMLFGDGMLNTQNTFITTENDKPIYSFLLRPDTGAYTIASYFAFAIWAATMFWAIVGSVLAVKRRNNYFSFIRAFIFVYIFYALLFSPSSSALFLVLPLFMLLMMESAAQKPLSRLDIYDADIFTNVLEAAILPIKKYSKNDDYLTRELGNISETGWMRAIEKESILPQEEEPEEETGTQSEIFVSSYEETPQPQDYEKHVRQEPIYSGAPVVNQPYQQSDYAQPSQEQGRYSSFGFAAQPNIQPDYSKDYNMNAQQEHSYPAPNYYGEHSPVPQGGYPQQPQNYPQAEENYNTQPPQQYDGYYTPPNYTAPPLREQQGYSQEPPYAQYQPPAYPAEQSYGGYHEDISTGQPMPPIARKNYGRYEGTEPNIHTAQPMPPITRRQYGHGEDTPNIHTAQPMAPTVQNTSGNQWRGGAPHPTAPATTESYSAPQHSQYKPPAETKSPTVGRPPRTSELGNHAQGHVPRPLRRTAAGDTAKPIAGASRGKKPPQQGGQSFPPNYKGGSR